MRLLVVDDKEGFREHLHQLFTDEGYQVITAASGEEAIFALDNLSPDIVITDLVMPNGDGFFTLRYIQERGLFCPVIVITGYGSQESAVKALRLGAYDYVTKPFELDVILATVKRAAEYCRLQQAVLESREKLATQVFEMSALYDTSLDLVNSLSLPQVLESLISRAVALLHAKGGTVYLYDEAQQQLNLAASRGPWSDRVERTLALGEGLAGKVAQSGCPLRVNDHSDGADRSHEDEGAGATCVVSVPLVVQDRVVGVLHVEDDARRGGFSEADEVLLVRLAPLAALAIERARLYGQTEAQLADVRRAHQEVTALQDLTAAIQSSLALPDVLNRIAEVVVQGLGYRAAMVAVYDPRRDALVVEAAVLDPVVWAQGEAMVGIGMIGAFLTMEHKENLAIRSARQGKVGITHHLSDLFRPAVDEATAQALQQMVGVHTLATVPLMADGHLVGNFFAGSSRDVLSEADIALLQAFARQGALAIEHARLFEQERRRHKMANTLTEVSRVINSTLELEEVLDLVLKGLESVIKYDSSAILLLERDKLRVKAVHGSLTGETPDAAILPQDNPLTQSVMDARWPVVIVDVQNLPGWYAATWAGHVRGWIGAPLIARDQVIGLLTVGNAQAGAYDEEDGRVVMAFAHQAALAIENARLFEQESRRRRLADMLRSISAIIGSTLDLEKLQALILEQVGWVFPYNSCGLFLLEEGRLVLAAGRHFSDPAKVPISELNETPEELFSVLLNDHHAFVLSRVPAEMQWPATAPIRVQSWIGAPLIVRDQVLGLLTINSYAPNTYHGEDEQHVMAFAKQVAAAIANARLYAETEWNLREQRYLQEIAQAFNSTLDLEQVLTLVMAKTNELLGVEAGSVALLSEDREELVFRASVGQGADVVRGMRMPASEGIIGWAISHRESLLVPDVAQDPRHYGVMDAKSGVKTRSLLCVPLVAKGTVIGAFEVLNKIGSPFNDNDLRMAEALALSAATAIENASLFQREKDALEKLKQMQDELVRTQRLVALGQIGVTVRHEVNNPLTVVLGNADWLLQALNDLEGEPLKALEAIRINALRIRDTVNRLGDIQTDQVTEYLAGIEMIDLHSQDTKTERGEEAD
jgi:GAF domain-containing protein/CheY-like chemotaxis protein